jgi:hypothetical protein
MFEQPQRWRRVAQEDRSSCVVSRPISDTELTDADIPGQDATWEEWPGIVSFAASFDGYRYWGSFAKCFEVGRLDQSRDLHELTLTELRTCLFCLYRSIAHDGESTPEDVNRAHVIIGEFVSASGGGRLFDVSWTPRVSWPIKSEF